MVVLSKVKCPRCGGSGSYSFNMLHGTKCYGCNGVGTILADVAKLEKQKRARLKREAERAVTMGARIAEGNRLNAVRVAKYQNDPRLGPETRNRCRQFEMVAYEAYKLLEMFDDGSNIHQSCIDRLKV